MSQYVELMLTFALSPAETDQVTDLEDAIRQLQQQVADIQAQLEALAPEPPKTEHSPEALAWAQRYGIDLDEFVTLPSPPPGTYTMSVEEAALVLNLSQEQVRRHLRAGRLHGVPLRGRAGWRVSRIDMVRFKAEREGLPIDLDGIAPRMA